MINQDFSNYGKKLAKCIKNDQLLLTSDLSDFQQIWTADQLTNPCSTAANLSIRYVTADEFHDIITGADPKIKFEPQTMYVVNEDGINAYNTEISNVWCDDETIGTCAANKSYVDAKCSEINEAIGTAPYIKKSGDSNIGTLHLSNELNVDGKVSFEKGIYIGNAPETLYAPSANMMFALGQNLSVLGTNSMSMGSGCIAGTNVLSVVDMYFTDDHTNGMVQNTMKLDSVEGLTPGMVFLAKITSNYGTTGTILNIDAGSKVISCDIIPAITKSGWTNIQTNCQANLANGQTMIGANKTTNQCVIWIKDHPEIGTIAYADGAHAEGIMTKATQDCCHAEGNQTVALGKYSHAEGNKTYAGYNGHSEGCQTSAMIILRKQDDLDRTLGYVPDSGDGGDQSMHAEGTATRADQRYTHADGKYTWARHRNSYAWNGDMTTTTSANMYQSHGEGTYNINPKNGISGFYIENKSLADHLQILKGCELLSSNWDAEYIMNKLIEIYQCFGGTVK